MQKKFSYRPIVLLVMIAVSAFAVACGGGNDEPATATSRPAAPTATSTSAPATLTPSGVVGDATRGAATFTSQPCSGCHSTGDNRIVGPGLKGVGERAAARGGDAYLTESIKDSTAFVVDGFDPIMPSFAHLDDQTVADLVAYLKTLK